MVLGRLIYSGRENDVMFGFFLQLFFMIIGAVFWTYHQYFYRPDIKENIVLLIIIISFTAIFFFKDIEWKKAE